MVQLLLGIFEAIRERGLIADQVAKFKMDTQTSILIANASAKTDPQGQGAGWQFGLISNKSPRIKGQLRDDKSYGDLRVSLVKVFNKINIHAMKLK